MSKKKKKTNKTKAKVSAKASSKKGKSLRRYGTKRRRGFLLLLIPFLALAVWLGYRLLNGKIGGGGKESSAPVSSAEPSEPEYQSVIPAESLEISMPEEETIFPVNLGNGIFVTGISNYGGYYVEDGSDELVSGIPVITLENKGTSAVQLMDLELTDVSGRRYLFELTTFMPGMCMTVLEKNRASYDASSAIAEVSVTRYSVFSEPPALDPSVLQVLCNGDTITLRNLSSESLPAGHLYYKHCSGDLLIGGITYSVSFPALAPGQSYTLRPSHFDDATSRILFVKYAE